MASKCRAVPVPELEGFERQFRALHKDWHYFYKLIQAYGDPRADSERRRALEIAFLELKSRISCDYSVLTAWRSGACGIPSGISDVFAEGTTLKSLSADVEGGRGIIEEEWRVVDEALGYIRQLLRECHQKTKPGKPAKLPVELFAECKTGQAIEKHSVLCRALQADWRRVHALMDAYIHPQADKRRLEEELLELKSKIACEYPTLPSWFGGRDEVAVALERILDGHSTLASLADGRWSNGRTHKEWRSVDESIGEIRSRLTLARADLARGKDVALPQGIVVQSPRRPFPVKKVLIRLSALFLIVIAVATVYFLRNFVGVGAPEAGAGIEVSATLEDEKQAEAVLAVMNESFVRGDVDMFMTTIANDFTDDEGNGRRALRIVLQAYHTKGDFKFARVIWSRAEFTRQDEWIYANPVIIQANVEGERDLYIKMGFKQVGGKWLISSAGGYG